VGWPIQQKIGDYYHMISRDNGADLAWAATFNGEEDVYYLRIPGGTTSVEPAASTIELAGAPNPLVESTALRFTLATSGRARLAVYDASGRRVAKLVDGSTSAGPHTARWNGADAAGRRVKPGLYLCRLETDAESRSIKLMVLR
jgi:hypothetical protein